MTDTPDQDPAVVAQSAVPVGVEHPVEALHEAVQEDEAAMAASTTPDPGPVPEAQTQVVATPHDAVATTQAAADAAAVPPFMPYKELFQLMGAVVFVMIVVMVGWSALHASGIWPE
ncbi:hypothetical protein B0W47_12815 [Komagataeibacter nataicola]|uniref:Uncharacterized protein n=1 Tax=Komagataeibacter nataicola TaxID=265960 RepID=A0A9N7C9X4_9PROT|nr:hypothetical protein [Komagataeibacter nataicola]AQU88198.1 hypothetical protein B0W47_12815 [Komagataeibacter nataicola]PYD65996.1 hypothetical protein CDI09_10350 [Komagataeibacter nataicola]WEQ54697.1 hypothetical protein LV564_10995 [Komagataeibacter nataicola]WNM09058.1 hypothetical protein RI056_03095 [Komagataeibacter nataicola]GBR20045.1 hypothetical protein AA0616_1692 [Komagataeibacter nataicola NRIC 0616]